MFSLGQLISWLVVGLAAGSLAALATTWRRTGYGLWRNVLLGLAGALIGGFAFHVFGIWPQLDAIAFSARDLVAAFIGSVVVVGALFVVARMRGTKETGSL
jgi:uncharacterized membrane protein YeaQ/YmgE (transglycosylase-associated protein family)